MEKSLIDTDIFSYYLRGDEKVAQEIIRYLSVYDKLLIPIISYYEINSGLEYKKAAKKLSLFKNFVKDHCQVLNLSEESVNISSIEYGKLRRRGITIGTSDLLIAGISIANNLRLVTNNTNHYKSIESLKLSNWKK